jgi:hypothetical protein
VHDAAQQEIFIAGRPGATRTAALKRLASRPRRESIDPLTLHLSRWLQSPGEPDAAVRRWKRPRCLRAVSMTGLLEAALPGYVKEGKCYLNLAVGCAGARHRSVFVEGQLASWLRIGGDRVRVRRRCSEATQR